MDRQLLDAAERELLGVILDLFAEGGPIARNILSVQARGRGIEVARPLLGLNARGLVEEIEQRPGFFRRLLGARTIVVVCPTEAALALRSSAGEATTPADATVADAPAAKRDDSNASVPNGVASTVAETSPSPMEADGPAALPSFLRPETSLAAKMVSTPEDRPAAAEPLADAPAGPTSPAATRQVSRANLLAFTEELGGTPLEDDVRIRKPDVAPQVMDGLRETLALVGMELTAAGELLIGDRIQKGASQGDALSQVVLFAFAHVINFEALGGGLLKVGALRDYAVGVMRTLEKLRDGGEIAENRFEEDMRFLWVMVQDTAARFEEARKLLVDPIGGMAPPAVLPEDLWQHEELEAWPD